MYHEFDNTIRSNLPLFNN
jgi:hypothetical protein